jgi:hypothetical protein
MQWDLASVLQGTYRPLISIMPNRKILDRVRRSLLEIAFSTPITVSSPIELLN